jgi:Tfp pilus assembly protein PilN
MSLNLARKPFVNRRPVRRAGYLLSILGLLLAVVNGYLYWSYLSGQGAAETGLQDVIVQLEEESRLLDRAREELAGLETEELNRKIVLVNLRIQQRTFSWSQLFDVFAETLPNDVRLESLTPRFGDAGRRGRRGADALQSDEVRLEIQGQAKSSEALLEFLDRLFAHPAFGDPDLHRENVRSGEQVIEFSISTSYRADAVGAVQPGSEEETEANP